MSGLRWWLRPEWRVAASVAVGGVLLTAIVAYVVARGVDDLHRARLERRVDLLATDIEEVVVAHTAVLYGIRSFHVAKGPIGRADFRHYVIDGGLLDRYPGAQAFELARRVEADEVPAYEASVRTDTSLDPAGYPQFTVHPDTQGRERWIVDYVEPPDPNLAAFGLDLGAERHRLAALVGAMDDGEPRTTAPITLVQETGEQAGILILLPLYRGVAVPPTGQARRDLCEGFALVVYRFGDMLAGVVSANDDLRFEVRDLDVARAESDSRNLLIATGELDGTVDTATLEVGGRTWELRASSAGPSIFAPAVTGAVGIVVTAVLTLLVLHLDAARRTATARARMLFASDSQRRMLERNLHDGAQQHLLAASLLLAQPSKQNSVVASARARIDESLVELRELAAGLHPAVVTDHGLVVALDQIAGRATIPVEVRVELSRRPPAAVEVAAYYTASEAMANVTKHADASRARVTASDHNGSLEITVCDDGNGRASPRRGSGLAGLADRARSLGGILEIASGPGRGLDRRRGTTVRAVLPCE